jgi:hypothetical protein
LQSLPALPWQPSVFRRQPLLNTVTEVMGMVVMGMVDTGMVDTAGTGTGATGTVVTTITAALASTSVPATATATGIRHITADTAAIMVIVIACTHLVAYMLSGLSSPFRQTRQASKSVYRMHKANTGCKE